MSVEIVDRDIFVEPFGVILHSCNCYHKMGAGIAKEIRIRYPRAYEVDLSTQYGDRSKLGQFSVALASKDQPDTILNMYTQHRYGRDKVYVEYDKFYECLENVKKWITSMEIQKLPMKIPFNISCNNAGGDWKKILSIINYSFEKEDGVAVYICRKPLLLGLPKI